MATKYNEIVETINARSPAIADKYEYLGRVETIPINVDASVQLVDSGDTIEFTLKLPNRCVAVQANIGHSGTNGLGASTTIQFNDGAGNALSEAVATSTDTAGLLNAVDLGNSDVSGTTIVGVVAGADWSDTIDLTGNIKIQRNA